MFFNTMMESMGKRLAVLMCCVLAIPLWAQETETNTTSDVNQNKIKPLRIGNEGPDVDSLQQLVQDLKDHPLAAKFDSLWLKELYDTSTYFDTIRQEVAQMDLDSLPQYNPVVSTDTLKARLARLDGKTPLKVVYNPSLEQVINMFLTKKRDFMERMLTKSQFYFPMFEQELDSYNVPLELKYLAIVESALNPKAKSRVGATGLWQFMYTTGKAYDLDVSSYVDERSDPIRSTQAACAYMGKLYDIFEDWDLVLAAYNSGPGNVNKAIRRSGGYENYWNIRHNLPRETAGYVPAFLAVMYIFEYAQEHGLSSELPGRYYFETDTIHVKRLMTFDQIASYVDVTEEELEVLNPAYKLNIIPFDEDKDYYLRLPTRALGQFVSHEKNIYAHIDEELKKKEQPLPQLVKAESSTRYRVQSGDYLGKIANRFGVRVSDIKRWNNMRSNNLRVGQRLTIYAKNPVTQPTAKKAKTPAAVVNAKSHTVQQGDSLWTISKKYPGVTIENLKKWNGLSGNSIKPGTKLKLCDCSS